MTDFNVNAFRAFVAANPVVKSDAQKTTEKAETRLGNAPVKYSAGEGLDLLSLGGFNPEVAHVEAGIHEFMSLFPDPDADIFSVPSALGLADAASDAIVGHYLGEPVIEA